MANKDFKVNIDFLLQFLTDKTKIEAIAKETKKILEKNHPEIALELNEDDIINELNKIVSSSKNLQEAFNDIEFNNDLVSDFNKLEKAISDLDFSDINELEKILSDLDIHQLEEVSSTLGQMFDDFDTTKSSKEINQLANEFDSISNESKSFLDTQKKALAMMELTGKKGTDEYKKLKEEIDKTESEVKKLDDAFGLINKSTESFTDKLSKFEAIGQVASMMEEFAQSSIQTRDALLNLKGRTGATGDELIRLNQLAEQAFLRGVGGSVAEAVNAIGVAKQSLGNFLNEKELLDFTNAAAGIAQVFDKDINEVINGSRTFIGQFGLEGKEAADLVAFAMQKSGSKMDDTLDTLDEYSQLVVKAGFDAKEFVGIVSTGMDMNVRDTDKLADAIKETQIRLNAGDTSKAIAEMSSPVTETIQEIVRLGEEGQLSIKEVLQQSNQVLKEAYNSGTITAALRDQFTVALSGTMAEDIGGELYTKIFSTKVDTKVISDQAKKAGEDISNALGPVTDFESLQRKIDLFANNLGNVFAPFIAGAGGALSSISQVAPALSLMSNFSFDNLKSGVTNIVELSKSIISKLVPGLITQTAVTEGTTVAQTKLNLAVLANPYVLAVAGIAALVVGLKLLSGALTTTAQERAESFENESKLIDAQIDNANKQKEIAKGNLELVNSFKSQGEEALKNKDLMIQLGKTYPGVISPTKSYKENLEALEKASGKTTDKLKTLDKSLLDLQNKKFDIEQKKIEIDVSVKKENLENELTDMLSEMSGMDWLEVIGGTLTMPLVIATDLIQGEEPDLSSYEKLGAKISEFVFGTSTIKNRVEDQLQTYTDQMYKASSSDEIKQAGLNLQMAILNGDGAFEKLSDDQKTKLLENVEQMTEAQIKSFEVQKNAREEYAKQFLSYGKSESEVIDLVAKRFKLSKEEAKKVVDNQKLSTDEAKKLGTELKGVLKSFNEIKNQSSTKFNTGLEREIDLTHKLKEARKNKDKESIKSYESELLAQKKINRETDKQLDGLLAMEERVKKQYEAKEKISQLELAKKEIESNNKIIELEGKRYDLIIKQEQVDQERETNSYDEYRLTSNQYLLEKKRYEDALKFLGDLIVKKSDGTIEIKTKVKLEREEVEQIIADLENNINTAKLELDKKNIQLKLDEKQINKELKEIELENLKANIEIGLVDSSKYDDIIDFYKSNMKEINNEIDINNDLIKEKEKQLDLELKNLGDKAREEDILGIQNKFNSEINLIKSRNKDLIAESNSLNGSIRDSIDKMFEIRFNSLKGGIDKETEKLNELVNKEFEKVSSLNEKFKNDFTLTLDVEYNSNTDNLDKEMENRLNILDSQSKGELAIFVDTEKQKEQIEKEYQEKRLEAENDYQNKKLALESLTQGIELEAQRQSNIQQYDLTLKSVDSQLSLYEEKRKKFAESGQLLSFEDEQDIKALQEQQTKIKEQLEENNSVWSFTLSEGADSIQGIISELFSGSGDAAVNSLKEYFGKVFGILAQALTKEIEGVVLKLMLDWFNWGAGDPIMKLAISPIIYQTISSALNAIATPILSSILSFSTGGEINSPQLAIIGDASKLGSENKEWIFRNDQLKQVINMATNNSNNELLNEIRALREVLSSQEIQTRLSGQDILLSLKRTQYNLQTRKI